MTVRKRRRSFEPIPEPGKRSGCANEAARIGRTGGVRLRVLSKGEYRHEKGNGVHGGAIPDVLGRSNAYECGSRGGCGHGMDADSESYPTDYGLHPAGASARERTEAIRRAVETGAGVATTALWSYPAGSIPARASRSRWTSPGVFDGQSRCAVSQYVPRLQFPHLRIF